MSDKMSRRNVLKSIAGTAAVAAVAGTAAAAKAEEPAKLKGNIKHSIPGGWRGRFKLDIPEFCQLMNSIGITGVDLVGPNDWKTYQDNGLEIAMGSGVRNAKLGAGFNDLSLHDALIEGYTEAIPMAAEAGVKQLICFSGNRNGLDDETGLKNCAIGLQKLMPLAEKHGVILSMELLNSRVNHAGYQCDKSDWGVELCKAVGSDNFRLLYDIYHMQIMEGDIIRSIQNKIEYFSHIHTAGNPGRHELDDTQELYYPAIMRAVVATGYDGFVAHEFSPSKGNDPLTVLKQAVAICDV